MKKNRKYFIFGVVVTLASIWAVGHFKSDIETLNTKTQEKLASVNTWL